jgi:rod shape-determining protein MreB and related proteins
MKVIRSFFQDHLAVDLGSVNTLICVPGRGIILNEPSVVALDRYSKEVLFLGRPAQKLLGREPRDIEVHRPIRGGTIDNFAVAQKMLKAFLKQVRVGHRRSHLVVGVPGSSTTVEQRSIREAAHDAKAGRVDLVDEGLAAGIGAGLELEDEFGHLVVDVGGGTTNIAIIAAGGGVISSVSLPVAGNAMDEGIRDHLRTRYAIQIGELTAETIKRELGAAWEAAPAEKSCMEVVGKQLSNGLGLTIEIDSGEVREALQPALSGIIDGIRGVIEQSPPEVTADIHNLGMILTGGGALLRGFATRLHHELHMHVALADNPLSSVAVGASRLLEQPEKLRRAAIREDLRVWEGSQELVVNW